MSRLMAAVSAGVGTSGALATVAGCLPALRRPAGAADEADASSGEGDAGRPASST